MKKSENTMYVKYAETKSPSQTQEVANWCAVGNQWIGLKDNIFRKSPPTVVKPRNDTFIVRTCHPLVSLPNGSQAG